VVKIFIQKSDFKNFAKKAWFYKFVIPIKNKLQIANNFSPQRCKERREKQTKHRLF